METARDFCSDVELVRNEFDAASHESTHLRFTTAMLLLQGGDTKVEDVWRIQLTGQQPFLRLVETDRIVQIGFAQFLLAGPNATPGRADRSDLLGLRAFDFVVLKAESEKLRHELIAAGATPASHEVFETLRIEAGTPRFGPDIDETRFVMEVAQAARAVSYTKGCYLGQEPIVMARDRAGHVNRAFLGMKVLEGGPLPSGAKLFHDGQDVGVVTSSCHSPRLGSPIALGYLRWKHQEVGTRMDAETPAGRQPVEVLGMPPVK